MKRIVVGIFIVGLLVSCSQKAADQDKQGPFIAKVGSAGITQADFQRELKSLPDYAQQLFQGEAGREKFLDEIIKKEILYQEALKKGIDKNPDFNRKLEEFKKLTLASELLEKEIMSKDKVTEQEVREYYDKHKTDFTTTSQLRASHILVKTEAEADKVLARLKKGEKFEDIAKKDSLDTVSAKNGGDIGYFGRGQLVPEFERAAAGLKVGEVSGPVQTQFGYHIIKVTDKKTGPALDFEKVKDVIHQRLSGERQKEAFDKYIAETRKNYKVEIYKDALAKMSQQPGNAEKTGAAPDKSADVKQKQDVKK